MHYTVSWERFHVMQHNVRYIWKLPFWSRAVKCHVSFNIESVLTICMLSSDATFFLSELKSCAWGTGRTETEATDCLNSFTCQRSCGHTNANRICTKLIGWTHYQFFRMQLSNWTHLLNNKKGFVMGFKLKKKLCNKGWEDKKMSAAWNTENVGKVQNRRDQSVTEQLVD